MSIAESQHAFLLLSLSYSPSPAVPAHIRAEAGWEKAAWMGSTKLSISAASTFLDRPSLTHCAPSLSSCSKHVLVNKTLLWQMLQSGKEFTQQKTSLMLVRRKGCLASTAVPLGKKGGCPWQLHCSLRATVTTNCSRLPWKWGVLPRSRFHRQEVHIHRQMWLQSSLYASGPNRKSLLIQHTHLLILHTHPCTL